MSCRRLRSLLLVLAIAASRGQALAIHPAWHVETTQLPDAKTGGWFINLGTTGARAKMVREAPTLLEVTYVFADTPAAGRLQIGDKITGVNGKAFQHAHQFASADGPTGYRGPMMDFGDALEESQKSLAGRLTLDVTRRGTKMRVVLEIPTTYGAFAPSYPYDCKRTDVVLETLQTFLVKRQRSDGLWHSRPHVNAFAALALLASGKKEHLPATRRVAKAMARATTSRVGYGGLDCWRYSLYGIFLAEYYLITGEAWVLAEIDEINQWLHKAQLSSGGWGHQAAYRFAGGKLRDADVIDSGYGGINVMTTQAMLAWALMRRCGLTVNEAQLQATREFIRRSTNKLGYVAYSDYGAGRPWLAAQEHSGLGRTGASALAHYLATGGDESDRRVVEANVRCIGRFSHSYPDTYGSPLLGMTWTALGSLTDPTMFRRLLDVNRWHFALAQCPDGTFYYQPNRDGSPQDYIAAPRLCASAVTALILSVKHKRLQITGAAPKSLPPATIDSNLGPPFSKPARVVQKSIRAGPAATGVSLPGLTIDLQNRYVDVDATVCLGHGSLELIACTKDTKEHESIVAVDARPMHIHTALLLLGASPGRPAQRKLQGDETKYWAHLPAAGETIEAFLVVESADGTTRERPISDFVVRAEGRVQLTRPQSEATFGHQFLFAGSHRLADENGGKEYLADHSGHVISISTFGDELLCLPEIHSHADGRLIWQVDSTNLPEVGTKVALRLRPGKSEEKAAAERLPEE